MWPIKTCIFFFGFIGACALSLVYPIVGIVNYMMVYQINPDKMWWGKPLEPLDIRYAMTAAVCLIVGMFISSGRVPKSRTIFGEWLILLFAFTGIVLFSNSLAEETSPYADILMEKMVKMTIFIACLTRMATTRKNFKIILWALVVGTLVIGNDAYNAPADSFFAGRLNFVGGSDFRESSGLAAHISAMLPLLGIAMLISRSTLMRCTALVAAVLACNTIVQCRTRSAFMGLLAGAAVAIILAPRGRRKRVYAAILVGALGGYSLTDDFFWTRMNTVLRPDQFATDSTIQGRLELWQAAGAMLTEHPLGVGVGRFRDRVEDYNTGEQQHAFNVPRRVTHNSYLLCVTELGLQGAGVFLALISLAFYKLWRCAVLAHLTENPTETRLLTYGCLLSMVIYLVAAGFTDRLYTESFWWVLAFPVCLQRAVVREVAALELTPALVDRAENWYERTEFDEPNTAHPPRCAFD